MLAHLEHQINLAALRNPDEPQRFVFWMPLNAYPLAERDDIDPLTWLEQQWTKRYPKLDKLTAYLKDRPSLLLLDALNEMPRRDAADYAGKQRAWRKTLTELRDDYPNTRVVFTCRSLDYGAGLSDYAGLTVPQVQFEALSKEAIEQFLRSRLPDDWRILLQHLAGTTRLELEKTPFYLDLEVRQFLARGKQAAPGPAALISGLVWQAMQRELSKEQCAEVLQRTQMLSDTDCQRVHSEAWLKAPHRLPSEGRLIPGLVKLAFAMQRDLGGGKQIRVGWDQIPAWIDAAGDTSKTLREAAWQLDLLSLDLVNEECTFQHQLVQEYFAAQRLAGDQDLKLIGKPWEVDQVSPTLAEQIAALDLAEPLPGLPSTGWEETTVHAAAITRDAEAFILVVADQDLPLAARCVLSPEVEVSEELKEQLRRRLLARSQDTRADLRARIEAGLALGELGDTLRFQRLEGVECSYLMPPLVTIAAGEYSIGSDQGEAREQPVHPVRLDAFAIGQFPVTNAEWQCFMDAEGYEDPRWWDTEAAGLWREGKLENTEAIKWWQEMRRDLEADFEGTAAGYPYWTEHYKQQLEDWLAWSDDRLGDWLKQEFGAKEHRAPSEWNNPRFNNRAQPVVSICWYEARAYCLWLSRQSGRAFALPSEAQWEAAARGHDGRSFPWGNTFDSECANTYEGHLRRTNPVGVYPPARNHASQAIYDQAGNCWEWTASRYVGYPIKLDDHRNDATAEGARVLRGGAWNDRASIARSAYRGCNRPYYRLNNVGFRVLCWPPSSGTDH